MTKNHPDLNEYYFETIDTNEKAYWLGYLYADGNIKVEKNGTMRVVIELNKKDEYIVDRFIQCIKANQSKKYYPTIRPTVALAIASKKLCKSLIKYGCIPNKTHILRLPELQNGDLYFAFLLGFYDGDGRQGTTTIISSSYRFLEQVKKKFKIKYRVRNRKNQDVYELTLGVNLFNKMMESYEYSLPRKRKKFCTKQERIKKIKESCKNLDGKKKFIISKGELERLVWEIPTTKIAKKFGVSDKAIEKRCKKFGIRKPTRGFWTKKGKKNLIN